MTALFDRLCTTGAVTLPRPRWSWGQVAEGVLTGALFVLAFAAGYAVLGPLVPLPF